MSPLNLGKYIQGNVIIPAGGDQYIAHTVIQAPPTHHLAINIIEAFGGDANEGVTIYQIPTNTLAANSEMKAGDIAGAMQISSFGALLLTLPSGQTDENIRSPPYSADNGRGPTMGTFPLFVLPAGYSLVAANNAANTNAITVNAGGFCVGGKYA